MAGLPGSVSLTTFGLAEPPWPTCQLLQAAPNRPAVQLAFGLAGSPSGWESYGLAVQPESVTLPAFGLAGFPILAGQPAFGLARPPRPAGMLRAWLGHPGQLVCQLLACQCLSDRPASFWPGRAPLAGLERSGSAELHGPAGRPPFAWQCSPERPAGFRPGPTGRPGGFRPRKGSPASQPALPKIPDLPQGLSAAAPRSPKADQPGLPHLPCGSLKLLRQRTKKKRSHQPSPSCQCRSPSPANWSVIFMSPCSAGEDRWKQFTCLAKGWSLVPPLPNLISGLAAPCKGSLHGGVFFVVLCVPGLQNGLSSVVCVFWIEFFSFWG